MAFIYYSINNNHLTSNWALRNILEMLSQYGMLRKGMFCIKQVLLLWLLPHSLASIIFWRTCFEYKDLK